MAETYDVDWPPPVYEMPTYVPYDSADLEPVTDILKGTMKSTTNTGMSIMGALVSVSLIFSIVGGFLRHKFGVSDKEKGDEFKREIAGPGIKRDLGQISMNRWSNSRTSCSSSPQKNNRDDRAIQELIRQQRFEDFVRRTEMKDHARASVTIRASESDINPVTGEITSKPRRRRRRKR